MMASRLRRPVPPKGRLPGKQPGKQPVKPQPGPRHGNQNGNQHRALKDKFENILRRLEQSVDQLSDQDLVPMLEKGVLVDGNTMFWADEFQRISCEKFARALSITWGSTPQYWTYKSETLSSGDVIEVAELLNVCWLDVEGQFEANTLTPGTEYEVVFDIKLTPWASGWAYPVNFTLTTPDGYTIQTQYKWMKELAGQGYKEIPIGKFTTGSLPNTCDSTVRFKLQEHSDDQWKRGLIVRGVIVRPVK